MAVKTDILAQIVLKEDDDKRKRTWTLSDKTVSESVWHYADLATNTSWAVPMGGVGTDAGAKILFVETDQILQIRLLDNKTTGQHTVQANGFYLAYLTGSIAPRLNVPGTTAANIKVAVFEV